MISIKRKIEGLHTGSCGSAIHPHFFFYFIVLVFRQATTTYVVLTLKANKEFLDVGPRVIM